MTEFKFEELRKKTVAQLRKIAQGIEHEALRDPAKMPKKELLAALCQALGIEVGESPEKTSQDKEPAAQESDTPEPPKESAKEEAAAVQEDAASESTPESSKDEEPAIQESTAAEASEKKVEDKEPAAQESDTPEPPKESTKEEAAAVQEDAASEPAPEGAEEEKPATKKSAKKKTAPAQESTPTETPAVVNKEKSKLKLQIRELKSQRSAALEAHDHVRLKTIRRRIRALKRKVRRIAA
jgi:hypothetical protein